jgi:hypothetical protein
MCGEAAEYWANTPAAVVTAALGFAPMETNAGMLTGQQVN